MRSRMVHKHRWVFALAFSSINCATQCTPYEMVDQVQWHFICSTFYFCSFPERMPLYICTDSNVIYKKEVEFFIYLCYISNIFICLLLFLIFSLIYFDRGACKVQWEILEVMHFFLYLSTLSVQFIVLFFILQVYNMWKIYLFAFKICYTEYFFYKMVSLQNFIFFPINIIFGAKCEKTTLVCKKSLSKQAMETNRKLISGALYILS